MRNRIIIFMLLIKSMLLTKRYIFQLTKCEHKCVSESIDSGDMIFSSVKPHIFFNFFLNRNILFPECSKKNQTYISDILTLCEDKKQKQMWKRGRSRPFFERAWFYTEWNNYSYAAHKANFFYKLLTRRCIFQLTKHELKGVSESFDFEGKNFSSFGLAE